MTCASPHKSDDTSLQGLSPVRQRSGISHVLDADVPALYLSLQPYNKTSHLKEEHNLGHSYKLTWWRCEKVGRGEVGGWGTRLRLNTTEHVLCKSCCVDRASYPQHEWCVHDLVQASVNPQPKNRHRLRQ